MKSMHHDKFVTYLKLLVLISILIFSCSKRNKEIVKEAEKYYENKQYDKAIDAFKKVIAIHDSNKNALYLLGRSYEELGDFHNAIEYFQLALNIDSTFAKAYRGIGFSYFNLEDYKKALFNYQKSLIFDSINVSAIGNLGTVYYYLGDYEKAREIFYKTISLNPDHFGIMHKLADLEYDYGNYENSLKLCYKVLGNLTSVLDGPHRTLGQVYLMECKYDSSIFHFTKAIEYAPTRCDYYFNRGLAFYASRKYSEALIDYNKAIELDSTHAHFYVSRGNLNFKLKLYLDALKDYNKAINLSHQFDGFEYGAIFYRFNFGVCYYQRALVKLDLGDKNGYLEDLKKAKDNGYLDNNTKFLMPEPFYKK